MTRSVIALFSQSFPQRLPHTWRLVWRANLARWMDWLLAGFLFVLPWFAIPHWFDAVELPKALLGIGVACAWLVLRASYSLLGSLLLEDGPRELRRWSVFVVWMGAFILVAGLAWLLSSQPALAWLGNGRQIGSSLLAVLLALWLVIAVRDALQRNFQSGRLFLRTWVVGVCVAVFGTVIVQARSSGVATGDVFSVAPVLDTLMFIPLLFLGGLALLATRAIIDTPLTVKRLAYYQLSHAALALTLIASLGLGLLIQLGSRWWLVLLGSIAAGVIVSLKQRRLTLAGFVSLIGIGCALLGIIQGMKPHLFSSTLTSTRQALHLEAVSEVLPNQRVSWQVVGTALRQAPFFGVGPGGWTFAFDQARPKELNQTPFWNAQFPRAASAGALFLAEYGLVPGLLVAAFCLLLIYRAVRTLRRTRDTGLLWYLVLFLGALGFAALRPMGVVPLMSAALFTGFLASRVFGRAKIVIPGSERPAVTRTALTVGTFVVIGLAVFAFQRAASAELLASSESYALSLARRFNTADDFTFAHEARFSLERAQLALNRSQLAQATAWLDRGDQASAVARARSPQNAEHVALELQLARLRAEIDQKAEERVLSLVATLDILRPTDPASPLAVFGVQRLRAAREQRWIEQGQGREKEEAIVREAQARQAADEALTESLARKSDYLPALYAQAAWLADSGKTAQAIASLEVLAKQNPTAPDILLPLALLYRRNQEPQKAISVLQQLATQAPTVLDYQWQLSLALVQAERWDEATFVLQRLVASAPQEATYQTQLQQVLRQRADRLTPVVPAVATSTTSTAPTATSSARVKAPAKRRVTR